MTARADFSGAWSNYFATEIMAAEAYSGTVERCQAAGVEFEEPSWWDYLTGKNRAKLVACKESIKRARPYYVDMTGYDPNSYDPDEWMCIEIGSNAVASMCYTSDVQLLEAAGLPTNYLDETPWFKLQYPSTSNGWHGVTSILARLLWTTNTVDWNPNDWRPVLDIKDPWSTSIRFDSGSYPVLMTTVFSNGVRTGSERLLNTCPSYEFTYTDNSSEIYSEQEILFPETYFPNAKGSWTTPSDLTAWATNYAAAQTGVDRSFLYDAGTWPGSYPSREEAGISWPVQMLPYMVKTRPRFLAAVACDTEYVVTNQICTTNYPVSEEAVVESVTNGQTTVDPIYAYPTYYTYDTNITTDVVYKIDGTHVVTNYVPTEQVTTSTVQRLEITGTITTLYVFGTAFVGSYATNLLDRWGRVSRQLIETNIVSTPEPSNAPTYVVDYYIVTTNVTETENYGEPYIDGYVTNSVYVNVTNTYFVTNTVVTCTPQGYDRLHYACGKTTVNATPYIGNTNVPVETLIYPQGTDYGAFGTPYIATGMCKAVSICYRAAAPLHHPPILGTYPDAPYGELLPWHGYNATDAASVSNWTVTPRATAYDYGFWPQDADNMGGEYLLSTANPTWTWLRQTADLTEGDSLFMGAPTDHDFARSEMQWTTFDAWFADPPEPGHVNLIGWEVDAEFGLVRWDVDGGFKWK